MAAVPNSWEAKYVALLEEVRAERLALEKQKQRFNSLEARMRAGEIKIKIRAPRRKLRGCVWQNIGTA